LSVSEVAAAGPDQLLVLMAAQAAAADAGRWLVALVKARTTSSALRVAVETVGPAVLLVGPITLVLLVAVALAQWAQTARLVLEALEVQG
jgi:hypothetical protein